MGGEKDRSISTDRGDISDDIVGGRGNDSDVVVEAGGSESLDYCCRYDELFAKAQDATTGFLTALEANIKACQTNEHHVLVSNEIEFMTYNCIRNLNNCEMGLLNVDGEFKKYCQPIINKDKPVPIFVTQKSDELLRINQGGEPEVENEREDEGDENENEDAHISTEESININKGSNYDDGEDIITATVTEYMNEIRTVIDILIKGGEYYNGRKRLGINIQRDTIEELVNILNLYPDVIGYSPPNIVTELSYDSIPFIPTLIQRWKERHGANAETFRRTVPYWEDCIDVIYKRCGLICGSERGNDDDQHNTIKSLLEAPPNEGRFDGTDCVNLSQFDERCAAVLTWLRNVGLFKKEDVVKYNLLRTLMEGSTKEGHFPARRFRVLVDLDPESLTRVDNMDRLPLYHAAIDYNRTAGRWFLALLEAGIEKFPTKKGVALLFQKTKTWPNLVKNQQPSYEYIAKDISPFSIAFAQNVKNKSDDQFREKIEAVLNNDHRQEENHHRRLRRSYNPVQAFIESATSNKFSLDGMYTILRRDPNVLQLNVLLSSRATGETDDDDDINNDNRSGQMGKRNKKKRRIN